MRFLPNCRGIAPVVTFLQIGCLISIERIGGHDKWQIRIKEGILMKQKLRLSYKKMFSIRLMNYGCSYTSYDTL
jgi:hypothetical protein